MATTPNVNLSKSYLGTAGELRAASELSLRGYVAHIPTVDEGADLWAVDHKSGTGRRLQIKTAAQPDFSKLTGFINFQISIEINLLKDPNIHIVIYLYVFGEWQCYVLTSTQLMGLRGKSTSSNIPLVLHCDGDVTVGRKKGKSINSYRDAWNTDFPPLQNTSAMSYAT
ncbi:hypothetical protein [Polaromonas sp. CG_9.5]|uniref:hypothetical protein n=1 Tax=Polaromonas sp. CG_9.5 TaxID=3071705 RepID=UPI002E0FBCB2